MVKWPCVGIVSCSKSVSGGKVEKFAAFPNCRTLGMESKDQKVSQLLIIGTSLKCMLPRFLQITVLYIGKLSFLKDVPQSYNDNVFMGFIYGIAKVR